MRKLTSVDSGGSNTNLSPNPNPNPNPNQVDSGGSSLRRKEGRERSFHIDDTPSAMNAEVRLRVRVSSP